MGDQCPLMVQVVVAFGGTPWRSRALPKYPEGVCSLKKGATGICGTWLVCLNGDLGAPSTLAWARGIESTVITHTCAHLLFKPHTNTCCVPSPV